MRLLPTCLAIATVLISSVATAQVNPSNEPTISYDGNEVVGEIAIQAADLSQSELKQLKADYDLHSNSAWSDEHDEIEIANVSPAMEDTVLAQMRKDHRIKFAEREHVFRADGWTPNDPMLDKQWNMKRIGMATAWTYSIGSGALIADVDTGVDQSLSDLAHTKFVSGYNFVDDNDNTNDANSHGSHVCGTLSQSTNNDLGVAGEAFGATILPVKVLSDNGSGTMAGVAEGIRYAADQGAQIISLSLGSSQSDNLTRDAVVYAQSKGALVVAAAGNSGDTSQHYPSNYPGVVCVGATDENDHMAKFSTHGKQLTIGSPGTNIVQQVPGGEFKAYNGSSMSTPGVSGVGGMLISLGLHGNAIKDALVSNADDKNDPTHFGAGILNAGKAVSHTYWSRFIYRTIALFFLAFITKRKINRAGGTATKPGTLGMLFASTGLLPMLPIVGMLPRLGSLRWLGELSMKPFGMWDITLLGANFHNWLPLASAIPVILLLVVGYGIKSFRSTIGGFAIGTAALLTQLIIQNDGDWSLLFRGWMVANAVVALWCARTVLDSKVNDATTTVPN
jgi:serine protease